MINLGSTDFHLRVPSIPATDLEQLSTTLFDSWESHVEHSLALPDYSLFLQVEEGSIKGAGKIGAALVAIYFGIGNYGDFISGLKTINEQLATTREFLAVQAGQVFSCPAPKASSKKSGGSLSSLQRLFVRVQKGELTPDQALARAEVLLGDELRRETGFFRDLENSLRNCPRFHEQLPLQLSNLDDEEIFDLEQPKRPIQQPRPQLTLGPSLQFRVEVWRDSKKKRKQTRVVRL
ncbi:MAG: hypothetical protein Q7U09_02580 [Hydrogenophaga sp.]|nr:hypothetical protein [Hydrogenophaga sp.]